MKAAALCANRFCSMLRYCPGGMCMFSAFFRDLRTEFAGYNADKLLKDVMAGLTVCAVALPLALAFGVSSGASAAAGLVTAILAGVVIAFLGGASYQVSGPTGAMSAVLIGIVAEYGIQGVFFACFAAGVLLLAAGFLKLGRLIGFIPMPVIMGFTSGIAIIIALGQVDNFFGTVSEGSSNLEKLASYARLGFHPNLQAVLIGALVVAVMLVWPKKWGAKVPGSLIGIIAATALAAVLGLDELAVVGDIPRTLLLSDRLHLGSLSLDMLSDLISPVVTIAALGMIESLLCGASAARMKSEPFHADQELIAQGVGNILLPFFGGVPATAAIARTSVAIKSGQQTRLTSVFHSVFLLASMFLLGGVMARLPLSALAGVLMVTAWRMNDWAGIRYIFAHRFKSAISQFLVTMLATVVFDLTVAIILGSLVVVALIALILIMALQGGKSGVDSVTLDHETAEIAPQDTLTLTATVLDANGQELKDETLTWSSSNAAVATVKDGVVTGVTEGKAKITVKAGKRSADCTVTVTNDAIEVKSLKLDQDKAEMQIGDSLTLKATMQPANAPDELVSWASSDPNIATVKKGIVIATSAGSVTITASAGSCTATCQITVKAPSRVDSVKAETDSATLDLNGTKTGTITFHVRGQNLDSLQDTVKVYAADGSVVSLGQPVRTGNGTDDIYSVTATAAAVGSTSVILQITAADGTTHSAACTVTVKESKTILDLIPGMNG